MIGSRHDDLQGMALGHNARINEPDGAGYDKDHRCRDLLQAVKEGTIAPQRSVSEWTGF